MIEVDKTYQGTSGKWGSDLLTCEEPGTNFCVSISFLVHTILLQFCCIKTILLHTLQ